MKKVLAFALALVLVLSFVGCGKQADNTPAAPSNPSTSSNTPAAPGGNTPAAPTATEEPVKPDEQSGVKLEMIDSPFGAFPRYTSPHTKDMTIIDPTTLWIGQGQKIESGNPHKGSSSCFYDMVFDRLIEYDLDTGVLTGVVFKDWEVAEDCSYVSFNMNENVTFHTGENATAEDVFYTLERCANPAISGLADKNIFSNIDFEKSEITGKYSGKIVLKTPSVTFLPGLTKCWLLSKSYIEEKGEDDAWWSNTVGTGPYKVVEVIEGDRYILKRNDDYWKGEKGPFENIVIRYYAEQATMIMDYETHNLDFVAGPSASDTDRAINGAIDNTIVEPRSIMATYSIIFNEEAGNPALKDVNVRKAIALALDCETIVAFAYQSLGVPANSVIPVGLPDSVPMAYEQNIEAAKQALKDAGYKPGECVLTIGTSNQGGHARAAETMQSMLEEVGFKINIIIADGTVNLQNLRNAGPDVYDMSITNQSFDTLESANFLGGISHACGSASFTGATDDMVDEIALKARAAKTVEEKQNYMRELQTYLHDNYWIIPICEVKSTLVYRDYLTGVRCMIPRMADIMKMEVVK